MSDGTLDIAAIRAHLAALRGRQYWQSLEELAQTDEFQEYLEREFPRQASVWDRSMDRRRFLKILGASLALTGLAGCVNVPAQKIVPYVKAPDPSVIPGKPLFYTTAMTQSGYAMGLLVESHLGRPTKVEGNPDHPASLGGTDTFAQASVLGLYDPNRSTTVLRNGEIRTYSDFVQEFTGMLDGARANRGEGIRILTEVISSPTLAAQIKSITDALPNLRWHQWEPVANDNAVLGARLAFGRDVNTVYRFDRADTILSLDSDFLDSHAESLRYAHDFIARRKIRSTSGTSMNRLYAVEGSPTLTGAKADHRLRVRSSQVQTIALALAARLGVQGVAVPVLPPGVRAEWLDALARDLQAHRGASIVIAGRSQPPAVHALAHAMNDALGSPGKTLFYTDPVIAGPADLTASLRHAGARHERRPRRSTPDPLRKPGLHRACRHRVCRGPQAGNPERARGPRAGRDGRSRRLAHSGNALLGNVGRCPGFRRHGSDRPAADRAALRGRPLGLRGAGAPQQQSPAVKLRDCARLLAGPTPGQRLRDLVAGRAEPRDGARFRPGQHLSHPRPRGRCPGRRRAADRGGWAGDRFPARSGRLGRSVCRQRLAAGAAQAAHQAYLG